jgi:hypothetical protein
MVLRWSAVQSYPQSPHATQLRTAVLSALDTIVPDESRRASYASLVTFDARSVVAALLFSWAAGMVACSSDEAPAEDEVGLPPRTGTPDAGTDSAPTPEPPDTGAPSPPCDLTKPFGSPMLVTEVNTAAADVVTDVSADELTMYIASNFGVTGSQLFFVTRTSKTAQWGPRAPLFPVGAWDNWSVSVTRDGLSAVVASNRTGDSDLFLATRATPAAAFGALTPIPGTNLTGPNDQGPRWSNDGKTFYLDSSRNGSRDLFVATTSPGDFTGIAELAGVNSPALDASPVLSADELTLYFLSDRAPTPDGDIYVATRASKSQPFGTPAPLPNVNDPSGLDGPGQISTDGCTLYFSSTRLGTLDIFTARRPD